jgi:hypothetical protein
MTTHIEEMYFLERQKNDGEWEILRKGPMKYWHVDQETFKTSLVANTDDVFWLKYFRSGRSDFDITKYRVRYTTEEITTSKRLLHSKIVTADEILNGKV